MKSLFLIVSLILTASEVSDAINCYSGINTTVVSTPGCTSCQTGALFMSSQTVATEKSCLTAACVPTNNVVNGNGAKVLCCSTDNCNNQVVTVNTPVDLTGLTNILGGGITGGAGTLKCYTQNNTIATGCRQCMKTTTNLVVSTSISRSCATACIPVDAAVYKIECCQTDLCNHASFLPSPAFLAYFTILLGAVITHLG